MSTFRPYSIGQSYLLPPDVNDWLSSDHFARFILVIVREELDLTAVIGDYESPSGRGAPAYNPVMMMSLLMYCYCIGVRSSRLIEDMTYDDLAVRFLTANQHPDHDSIANFRKRHKAIFKALFRRSLELCAEAGLLRLGDIDLYLDGTKMLANASRHNTVSYSKVRKTQEQLRELVERITREADAADAAEDEQHGVGNHGSLVPEEFKDPRKARELLRAARERLDRVSEIRDEMESSARAEAEQAVEEAQAKYDEHEKARMRGRKPVVPDVDALALELCSAKRVNLTDPDSRLMKDGATKAIVQAYNCQVVVTKSQIIVACDATNEENDLHQLAPMAQMAADNLAHLDAQSQQGTDEKAQRRLGADTGYLTVAGVSDPRASQFDLYIAPGKDPGQSRETDEADGNTDETSEQGKLSANSQSSAETTPAALLREQMRQKIATEEGKEFYRHRSTTVEPVFGQTKEARGIRRLLLRGNADAKDEWNLICTTHNILKLFRHKKRNEQPLPTKPDNSANTRKCVKKNPISIQLAFAAG